MSAQRCTAPQAASAADIDFNQPALGQPILSCDAMLIEELQHVHSGALQPKQQQQELLRYLNPISTDVMIGELPRVHSGALQLKQQSMLLIDFNQLSLEQPMLSSDAMLIDELQHVHSGALQPKQQQQELLSDLTHILIDVVFFEQPRVHSGVLQLKQQSMPLIGLNQLSLKRQILVIDAMLIDELQHVQSDALQLEQPQQELLGCLSHISTNVVIGRLPRVHSGALQHKQQSIVLILHSAFIETTDAVQ